MTWEEYSSEEEIEFMRFVVLVQDDVNDKRIAQRILRRAIITLTPPKFGVENAGAA